MLGADREDQPEPLVAQPPQHEGQHPGCGPIQPLQVIDADHDWRVRGERAQNLQRGKRHGQLIEVGLLGLAAQQRDLQGTPLRGRQLRQPALGTPSSRSISPPNGRVASAWAARAASTVNERARAACSAACHTVVLPIPAGPSTTTARGPATTASSMAVSCSSSAWRPSTTGAISVQS
jgi:hypothetical protein